METGAITGYIDVAQLVLYAFWIFFFILVFWLHRESKREGYPLEPDTGSGPPVQGFPAVPKPKTFRLPNGSSVTVPENKPEPPLRARRLVPSAGSPYEPEGDPMLAAVGPGAYANRAEVPDAMFDGTPRLRPLSSLPEFHLDSRDPDPRGMDIVGTDGVVGGKVVDVWVDRAEYILRYYEFEKAGSGERGLIPMTMTQIPGDWMNLLRREAKVGPVKAVSITGAQFADVPAIADPTQITLREEERVVAYYGGGYLYAEADRKEPLL